jgi:hypothetical protein
MPKRIDFAKHRRNEGCLLSKAVRELAASMISAGHKRGIDLQTILDETSARKEEEKRLLTERLQQSVVPLFINRAGRPDRIGSCVLVRQHQEFYAFTAAHVIEDSGGATLFAPSEAKGGKLRPLPLWTAHLKFSEGPNNLDSGVLVLPPHQLGAFEQHTFLTGEEIDNDDRPDDQRLDTFYFVLGYSASRTQVTVSQTKRRIHQQSFRCSTSPVDAAEYAQEQISQRDHILLDFDHKEIRAKGRRATPPKLQGVSGGGIFQIRRETMSGSLVAIATRNRRTSRLIVGSRIKNFLAIVRELKGMSRP